MSVLRALIIGLTFVGCAGTSNEIEVTEHTGPTISTDQASYTSGQNVVVTWAGLPGNPNDWIAIAPAGSPAMTVTSWVYAAGAQAGSHGFAAPSFVGNYVARAFVDDSYTLLAESASFSVSSSGITTDLATYSVGQSVMVSWTGLPGNANDWISLAPAGSSVQTVTKWIYTNGVATGSTLFSGLGTTGSYVARAFLNDSYSLLAESSPFAVVVPTGATITTDRSTYPFFDVVTVTWSGMPGSSGDWVATALQGASASNIDRWAYTGGTTSGSKVFTVPNTPGNFVARGYASDSYTILGESAPASVQTAVTTDASSYNVNFPITVNWATTPSGLPIEVVIAPAGSNISAGVATSVNPGPGSRVVSGAPAAGSYVARIRSGSVLVGESAAFTVAGAPIVITTSSSTYTVNSGVSFTWFNMPGNPTDWIGIAPQGSPNTTVYKWLYINGRVNGSDFLLGPIPVGTWVVRGFSADSYNKVGESAPFTVQ